MRKSAEPGHETEVAGEELDKCLRVASVCAEAETCCKCTAVQEQTWPRKGRGVDKDVVPRLDLAHFFVGRVLVCLGVGFQLGDPRVIDPRGQPLHRAHHADWC